MIKLRRIDHVSLRVADLEQAARRWSIQFGLTETFRTEGRVYLRCGYEPYSLELVQGEPAGLDHHAYELAQEVSLQDAAAHLDRTGVAYDRCDGALCLADVEGNRIELRPYLAAEDPFPDVAKSTTVLPGFRPRKLGHMNFLSADLAGQISFYTNVLGMHVTDRLADEGAWLHINADHHVLALVDKGYAHVHHFALEYVDWGELRIVLDHLAQHGRWIAWGPVRHGLGRNLAAYVRIPEEECFVEIFSDLEQLEPDHQERVWPDTPHSSNVWGILPPRSYFRFDPEALDAERKGLEALGVGISETGTI